MNQTETEPVLRWLSDGVQAVGHVYFMVLVAGTDRPALRERIYCYELYHQLRMAQEKHRLVRFTLYGEPDKSGHPNRRDFPKKPDFIIHEPGYEDNNLAVVEVKLCTAPRRKIEKDMKTLQVYVGNEKGHYGYEIGILLVVGEKLPVRFKEVFFKAVNEDERFCLFHHRRLGSYPIRIRTS